MTEYSIDHLKAAMEKGSALTLIREAVDIAVIEYNGEDCRCSKAFASLLADMEIDPCVVKKVIVHGRNRLKLRRQNVDLNTLYPEAEIVYTGIYDVNRFSYGPIRYMLAVHFFPEMDPDRSSSGRLFRTTATEGSRFLYNIIVDRKEVKTSRSNPFSVESNTDLMSMMMQESAPKKEFPKFCAERRASFKRLIDKSYLSAALEQCLNEVRNGCEECPLASSYGSRHECPYFQLQLSEFYRLGTCVPKSEAIAYQWVKKAALQGYPEAEFIYARRLEDGRGCEKDIDAAYAILHRLAKNGDLDSAHDLATIYPKDSPYAYRRLPWIIRLAKNGDYEMQDVLIEEVYSKGVFGIPKDEGLLSKWVDVAAESGNVGCIERLANRYEEQEDWENALKWVYKLKVLCPDDDYSDRINNLFVKTLDGMETVAIVRKADNYYDGIDTDIDYNKAYLCYSHVAEESAEAMFGQARCLERGRGVEMDEDMAVDLYEEAASRGSVRAMHHLYEENKESGDENLWAESLMTALNEGVENDNIYALLIKASMLIYPKGLYDEDKPEGYRLFCRAKDIGSVEAIRQVAMCLCEGYGVQKDFDRAQELFRIAADRGVASAMRCLGCTFKHGLGNVSADRKISEQWYLKAANHEDSQSQYIVGKLLEKNNPSNAVDWYMRAAHNGNTSAQAVMAERLYYGRDIKKDLTLAREWAENAAAAGEKDVYFRVAYMCCDGIGGPKDYPKAIKYYTILAEEGNSAAINNLAWMTEGGKGVEKDYTKASEMYLRAATLGDKVAMRNIAQNYKTGTGIEKDYSKYLEWMNKGAESGNVQCMYDLAELYRKGDSLNGVDIDVERAISYYNDVISKATTEEDLKENYENALMTLADIYYYGRGVAVDDNKALSLHRKAAESGVVKAYFMLGEHYYYAYGIEEDEKMAIFWYRKAAEKDYQAAKDKLDELGVDYLQDDEDDSEDNFVKYYDNSELPF